MQTFRLVFGRLIDFYELLILAKCILSWIPIRDGILRDVHVAVDRLTEPCVGVFRRLVPGVGGGGVRIDFSPMVAIIVLDLIKRVVLAL